MVKEKEEEGCVFFFGEVQKPIKVIWEF